MSSTFDDAINAFNEAQHHYLNGNPAPVHAVFSRRDDVTLCNPVGPPCRGPENVVLAGSSVQPGVGVPMVLISGRLAAERITGRVTT